MGLNPLSRRSWLSVAGLGAVSLLAGCGSPANGDPPSLTTEGGQTDPSDRAGDQDLYQRSINSVPLIRAFGVETRMSDEEGSGQGSGFVVDDSYVITNEHVVSGASEVDIQYTTGEWSSTSIIGTDVRSDLAVLEPDHVPDPVPSLAFTDTRPAEGQEVKAVGNPFGLRGTISRGIISGINRTVSSGMTGVSIPDAVQTDAAINPGNSGGPLLDSDGAVVGVISAGGGENIGFAISAALSRRVIPALIDTGAFRHSFLGATHVPVDPFIAEANDRSDPGGVLVVDVAANGPADGVLRGSDASVERHGESLPVGGDIILEMDGTPVRDSTSITTYLALETSPGDDIRCTIDRDGTEMTVELTLGVFPTP
ncbi:MAG: trypsin-like peptidase domain-containing protein [Halovenus sp.]